MALWYCFPLQAKREKIENFLGSVSLLPIFYLSLEYNDKKKVKNG